MHSAKPDISRKKPSINNHFKTSNSPLLKNTIDSEMFSVNGGAVSPYLQQRKLRYIETPIKNMINNELEKPNSFKSISKPRIISKSNMMVTNTSQPDQIFSYA